METRWGSPVPPAVRLSPTSIPTAGRVRSSLDGRGASASTSPRPRRQPGRSARSTPSLVTARAASRTISSSAALASPRHLRQPTRQHPLLLIRRHPLLLIRRHSHLLIRRHSHLLIRRHSHLLIRRHSYALIRQHPYALIRQHSHLPIL